MRLPRLAVIVTLQAAAPLLSWWLMSWRFTLMFAVLLLLAAGLGLAAAPRYHPPADSGEARLRERAAGFYRAQRLFDYLSIARYFTPARQHVEGIELARFAAGRAAQRRGFDKQTIADFEKSAATITPDSIEVELDGDWAVTRCTCTVIVEGVEVPMPLDAEVWVRSGGDWWVYQLTNAELEAYGNPPDFARSLVSNRDFGQGSGREINIQREPESASPPAEAEQPAQPPAGG